MQQTPQIPELILVACLMCEREQRHDIFLNVRESYPIKILTNQPQPTGGMAAIAMNGYLCAEHYNKTVPPEIDES